MINALASHQKLRFIFSGGKETVTKQFTLKLTGETKVNMFEIFFRFKKQSLSSQGVTSVRNLIVTWFRGRGCLTYHKGAGVDA